MKRIQTRRKKAQNQNKNKPKTSSVNSSFELLKQKGYEVITGATIKNTFIDFIGVSKSQICLCLNDKEPGDWLADEERFNELENSGQRTLKESIKKGKNKRKVKRYGRQK